MKKIISICTIILTLLIAASAVVNAETVYKYQGYSYTYLENGMASVCGWDNSSSVFVVPNMVSDVYVLEIARNGMQNNTYIKSVDFSEIKKLNTIGGYAFENCSSINGCLSLPRKIGFIGDSAFMNCSSIESVEYSSNTDTISRQCFKNCSALKNVVIDFGPKEFESYSFENCTSLESITIPKSVTSINSTAFNGCSDFTIKGYRDSYAQQFAEDNGYEFEILDPLYGDANGDGKVNILDVTAIQRYKIGDQDLSDYGMKCADVNKDGSVTIRDATLIQMKLAKYDVDF